MTQSKENNREKRLEYSKNYYKNNLEYYKTYFQKYYDEHQDKFKQYYKDNKEKRMLYQKIYIEMKKLDPNYKIVQSKMNKIRYKNLKNEPKNCKPPSAKQENKCKIKTNKIEKQLKEMSEKAAAFKASLSLTK